MNHPVGLVPTMGALHQGHLELVRRARQENASVIVSIFVNPAQFGPQEDFSTYPRDLAADTQILASEMVDVVFTPSTQDIYPTGFDTWVEVNRLSDRLEGQHRPGHFKGVSTIIVKLFNLLRPDKAYFGEKDAQQLLIIKKLAVDLHMGVEIISIPTVRNPDGLALSSRNNHLEPDQLNEAPIIYKALDSGKTMIMNGELDCSILRRKIASIISQSPLTEIEYLSISDLETLEELEMIDRPALISTAVRIGKVRLIDNVKFIGQEL
jgi:pantoate--beta-alanine ligase